ncbi:SPOR domain-containing protein, partial [Pandoraea pnomenusa]|uniref:SPOR domain-containing protein n=1 Tax=Pandoraea pnomenusa TaxID=93220 RepID=UPI003CF319D0
RLRGVEPWRGEAVGQRPAPTAVPEPQVAQVKPEVKPEAHKPDAKKPEQHADAKPAAKPDTHDTARAQAKPQSGNAADPIAQFAQNNTGTRPARSADNHDATQKPAASGGKYLVRIGAFSTQDRAQAWLVKLKLVNVPSYMVKSAVDGRELYLLRAGPFPDRASAEAAGKKIRDAGLTAQVAEAG